MATTPNTVTAELPGKRVRGIGGNEAFRLLREDAERKAAALNRVLDPDPTAYECTVDKGRDMYVATFNLVV